MSEMDSKMSEKFPNVKKMLGAFELGRSMGLMEAKNDTICQWLFPCYKPMVHPGYVSRKASHEILIKHGATRMPVYEMQQNAHECECIM